MYGHTHCTVRWFPHVEVCLDVCCELDEGKCSRVSAPEAVVIFMLDHYVIDITTVSNTLSG